MTGMIGSAVWSLRDEAFQTWWLQHPAEAGWRAWCAERDPSPPHLQDTVRAEVLLLVGSALEAASEQRDLVMPGADHPSSWWNWPIIGAMSRTGVDVTYELHQVLTGDRPRFQPGVTGGSIYLMDFRGLFAPSLRGMLNMAAKAPVTHATRRLAVRLHQALRQDGRLPADLAGVIHEIGDGSVVLRGGDRYYRLRYERLSDTRARLAIDPAGSVPVYLDDRSPRDLSAAGIARLQSRTAIAGVRATDLAAEIDGLDPTFPAPPLPHGVH